MADTGKRKEGLSGGRRGARLSYKSGRRRAQPRCRPSIPASVPHAPTPLSGHCQVPVTFSLRSRPHAAAEGGAPGLSRAESCVPGTLGWARKPLLGRRLQNHRTTEPPKGGRGRAWPRGWDRTRINPGGPRTPTPVLWARAGLKGTGVSARCILDSVPQISLPPLPNDPSVTRLSQLSPSLLGLHGGPCWACVLVFTDLDSWGPHKTHVSRAPALG